MEILLKLKKKIAIHSQCKPYQNPRCFVGRIDKLVLNSNENTRDIWHKSRHLGQWNKIESPEINLPIYGQLISDKVDNTIQMVFSTNGARII